MWWRISQTWLANLGVDDFIAGLVEEGEELLVHTLPLCVSICRSHHPCHAGWCIDNLALQPLGRRRHGWVHVEVAGALENRDDSSEKLVQSTPYLQHLLTHKCVGQAVKSGQHCFGSRRASQVYDMLRGIATVEKKLLAVMKCCTGQADKGKKGLPWACTCSTLGCSCRRPCSWLSSGTPGAWGRPGGAQSRPRSGTWAPSSWLRRSCWPPSASIKHHLYILYRQSAQILAWHSKADMLPTNPLLHHSLQKLWWLKAKKAMYCSPWRVRSLCSWWQHRVGRPWWPSPAHQCWCPQGTSPGTCHQQHTSAHPGTHTLPPAPSTWKHLRRSATSTQVF